MLFAKELKDAPQLLLEIVLKRIYADYDGSVILRQHITKVVQEAKQISIGEIDLFSLSSDSVSDVMYISRHSKEFLSRYDSTKDLTRDDIQQIIESFK